MNKRERNEEMAKLYLSGQTLQEVGERYNISRQAVQLVLKCMDIPRRIEPGARRANNMPQLKDDEYLKVVVVECNKKIEFYRRKYKTEKVKNSMLKSYYKKRMLNNLLED